MKEWHDYLIVGSGLYGATFAYMARQQGRKCMVIDRREQAGGNVACRRTEGIDVHLYGPHIFHTDDELTLAEPHTIFGGRLATYRYMNMDEVMASAMRRIRQITLTEK